MNNQLNSPTIFDAFRLTVFNLYTSSIEQIRKDNTLELSFGRNMSFLHDGRLKEYRILDFGDNLFSVCFDSFGEPVLIVSDRLSKQGRDTFAILDSDTDKSVKACLNTLFSVIEDVYERTIGSLGIDIRYYEIPNGTNDGTTMG